MSDEALNFGQSPYFATKSAFEETLDSPSIFHNDSGVNGYVGYSFGVEDGIRPKIISFNPHFNEFTLKSTPPNLPILQDMSILDTGARNELILSGGRKQDGSASENVFAFRPHNNKVIQMPKLYKGRFCHMSFLLDDRLFMIGGATTAPNPAGEELPCKVNITATVEVLDLQSGIRTVAPKLNKPRAAGHVIAFNRKLHVFGGRTVGEKNQFSRSIERLDENEKRWEVLDFKLLCGVEGGLLLPWGENASEFIVLGGQNETGALNKVIRYNFGTKTAVAMENLLEPRFPCKGVVSNGRMVIYGGNTSITAETYEATTEKSIVACTDGGRREERCRTTAGWHEVPASSEEVLAHPEEIDQFTQAVSSLKFEQEIVMPGENSVDHDNKTYLFGTHASPHILELNFDHPQLSRRLPVPLTMRPLPFACGLRISDQKYFVAGGISRSKGGQKISRNAVIYKPNRGKVRKLPKMTIPRYGGAVVKCHQHVYMIGGKTTDDEVTRTCERLSVAGSSKYGQWEQIASLNQNRIAPAVFVMKDKIFVCGGSVAHQMPDSSVRYFPSDTFEVYDATENKWKMVLLRLPAPVEAPAVFVNEEESTVYLFGGCVGTNVKQQVWKIQFTEKMDSVGMFSMKPLLRAGAYFKPTKLSSGVVALFGGTSKSNFVQFYSTVEGKPFASSAKIDLQDSCLRLANAANLSDLDGALLL